MHRRCSRPLPRSWRELLDYPRGGEPSQDRANVLPIIKRHVVLNFPLLATPSRPDLGDLLKSKG